MRDDATDQQVDRADTPRRSMMMAVSALTTLLVAGWCLADGPVVFRANGMPWALLAVGIVVGVALIASGFRRG